LNSALRDVMAPRCRNENRAGLFGLIASSY
jgi:hypothetical protein